MKKNITNRLPDRWRRTSKVLAGLIALYSGLATVAHAQVSTNYVFSQSSGTYTPLTGGTVVGTATNADPTATPETASMDDYTYTGITLPFTFNYAGTAYTSININTNGWASFTYTSSTSTGVSSATNSISPLSNDMMGIYATTGTTTNGSAIITAIPNTATCAIGAAVKGTGIPTGATITAFDATSITISSPATASATGVFVTWTMGEIRTDVVGTAPNRTFVIQFKNMSDYSNSVSTSTNNAYYNFQIRLNEGGGVAINQSVDIVYGNFYRASSTRDAQVGISGASDYSNRTSTTSWSGTTAGTSNTAVITSSATVLPASGLTFTWTPATCPSVAAATIGSITYNSASATWSGSGSYILEYGLAGFTPGTGASAGTGGTIINPAVSPQAISGLSASTSYNVYVRQNCTGAGNGFSANSPVTSFTTSPAPPANDEAAGALPLTVNADLACAVTTNGTTVASTQSADAAPACNATAINDDVWYTFTASTAAQQFKFTNVTSSVMAVALYTGAPGSLTAVSGACGSGATVNLTGLSAGTTYYARLYTTSTGSTTTTFTVCVGTLPNMTYVSSTTSQPVTTSVNPGNTKQQIIRTDVVVTGASVPLSLSQIDFNTTGTTNAVADIANAKVYYAGTSTTFDPATQPQFGATINNPNGSFSVTGAQVLTGGASNTTNYFFLTYDIPCAAPPADVLDAQCTAITVAGTPQTPTATNPTGTRAIAAATTLSTVADGDWSSPATWACGTVPPTGSTDVTINNNVTVTTTGNTVGNITIASGKTLTISNGNLTMGTSSAGAATGNSNKSLTANGTLTITGGTLNLNGAFSLASSGTFNMSAGIFNLDPNDGTSAGSATGDAFYVNSITAASQMNITGGNINLLDPPYVSGKRAINFSTAALDMAWPTACVVTLGGGDDVNTANASGFYIESNTNTGTLEIGNLVVNGGRFSAQRHASTNTSAIYITKVKNLTVNAGAEFVVNLAVLAVTGDVVNNGMITVTSATVDRGLAFVGDAQYVSAVTLSNSSNAQSLTGTGYFKKATSDPDPTAQSGNLLAALSVWQAAGAPGVTLGMPVTVTSQLRLNSGMINTSSTNFLALGNGTSVPGSATTLTATAGTIYGNSATAYTSTAAYAGGWVNGPFNRWVTATTTSGQQGLMPVGLTAAKPAQIVFTAAPATGGYLTASWIDGSGMSTVSPALTEPAVTPATIDNAGNAMWQVSNSGTLTGGTYTAVFTDPASTIVSSYANTTLLKRANAAAPWAIEGTHVATTGSNSAPTLSRSGLTSFSQFAIGGGGTVLPVDLVFTGSNTGTTNNLSWETTHEENFSHFELQRSADGKSFSKLATIHSKGIATGSQYGYADERPFDGKSYYRLNMVDNDGRSALSKIVVLTVVSDNGLSVSVHPNPVKQQLNVEIAGKTDGKGQVTVLDITGKTLRTIPAGSNTVAVDMSNLPAGTYMIRYTDNSHSTVIKVAKN